MNTIPQDHRSAVCADAPYHEPALEKIPGHWLLARMGKRVLRPGGIELTRELLAALDIGPQDDVVEFAPGLGATARLTLARAPRSYTAVERDRQAAATVEKLLQEGAGCRCVLGTAEMTGLGDATASVVYGEAMLTMQPVTTRERIVTEAARLLAPGGRYGIHELCVVPDDVDQATLASIQQDLSREIHVGVRPLSAAQWRELLDGAGLNVIWERTAPMHLLEPARLIRDEGFGRAVRFVWNVARHAMARRRVLAMRKIFRKHRRHLAAIALVAEKAEAQPLRIESGRAWAPTGPGLGVEVDEEKVVELVKRSRGDALLR